MRGRCDEEVARSRDVDEFIWDQPVNSEQWIENRRGEKSAAFVEISLKV